MKRNIFIALLIIFTVFIGFFRDYIFVSINEIIESGYDVNGKYSILKWVLTLLFSLIYLGITVSLIYLIFRSMKYVWLSVFVYGFVLFVSALILIGGILVSSFQGVYPFVRTIMGIAQSPIILMVLIPACFVNEAKLLGKKG